MENVFTLKEVAKMCGLDMEEAISDVCDCDLTNGWSCYYHRNPEMKATLLQWQHFSIQGDQYGILKNSKFYLKQNNEGPKLIYKKNT